MLSFHFRLPEDGSTSGKRYVTVPEGSIPGSFFQTKCRYQVPTDNKLPLSASDSATRIPEVLDLHVVPTPPAVTASNLLAGFDLLADYECAPRPICEDPPRPKRAHEACAIATTA